MIKLRMACTKYIYNLILEGSYTALRTTRRISKKKKLIIYTLMIYLFQRLSCAARNFSSIFGLLNLREYLL